MSVDVIVPAAGESVTEGLVGQWFKKEGDHVEQDEILVELETDKVTMELPAPVAGKLSKILAAEGATVQVGDVIAKIEEGAQGVKSAPKAAEEAPPDEQPAAAAAPAPPAPAEPTPPPASGGETRIMPAAARLLKTHNLNANQVKATGPGGRLLKEDVERHVKGGGSGTRPAAPKSSSPMPKVGSQPIAIAAPANGERIEEAVPMTPIRKRIAQRLVAAQEGAALLTTFNEIDMTAVKALRAQYKEPFLQRHGVKLGFMSFFVKAAVDALRQFPQINAEIRDEHIIYRNYCDIGIAVSTPRGLMVPVLKSADRMSFAEVEGAINNYGLKAREGKIKLEDITGGTFTITNGGTFGSMMSTPIINPPQSGVLGMHAIVDRPVAINGEVKIRPIMYVALTYDHRIVDGREAVTFLYRIKETIENPTRILLEV